MIETYNINLDQAKESLIKKEKQINKYFEIMNEFNSNSFFINDEFKTKFKGFYRIRQRSKDFYDLYFNYLIKNKENNYLNFEEVLKYFYQETNKFEKSFGSKLLATINPNMPVWDSIVLEKMGLKEPNANDVDRMEKLIKLYETIILWYDEYLEKENTKSSIDLFDSVFPNNNITNIKKVDLILWSIRKQ